MNSRPGRTATLGLATALAAGALLLPATAASASDPLGAGLYCISLGHSYLECQLTISGGTAPYAAAWTRGAGAGPFRSIYSDGAIVSCERPYTYVTVNVTVTDGLGATAAAGYTVYCGNAV